MFPFYYSFDSNQQGSFYYPFSYLPVTDGSFFSNLALYQSENKKPQEGIKKQDVNTDYAHPAIIKSQPSENIIKIEKKSEIQNQNNKKKKIIKQVQTKKQKKIVQQIDESSLIAKNAHSQVKTEQKYITRNYQSNIVNKVFAFLWSQDKSKIYVMKILKDRTKTLLFYDYIKIIRKYCKRYQTKEYLANLCDYKYQHIAYRIVTKRQDKIKYYSMAEFSLTVRKLIHIYLKTFCCLSILTSKKMRATIWKQHLNKMRFLNEFLFGEQSSKEQIQIDNKNQFKEQNLAE